MLQVSLTGSWCLSNNTRQQSAAEISPEEMSEIMRRALCLWLAANPNTGAAEGPLAALFTVQPVSKTMKHAKSPWMSVNKAAGNTEDDQKRADAERKTGSGRESSWERLWWIRLFITSALFSFVCGIQFASYLPGMHAISTRTEAASPLMQ